MGTTNTKSVAARLPYDEYINVITKASELRLTTSDYLILKLHEVERLPQLERDLSTTQASVLTLKSELTEAKKLVSTYENTIAQWQAHTRNLEATIKTGQEESTTAKGEVASLTQKIGDATTNEKLLQKQIADLKMKIIEWETYATNLKEASATSKDQHQTETSQFNTHIAAQNALLMSRDAKVNRLTAELVEVKGSMEAAVTQHRADAAIAKAAVDRLQTDLTGVIQRANMMYDALEREHNSSRLNIIPKAYWPILDSFMDSLDEKKP